MGGEIVFDQAFFGSFSGEDNFDVISASTALSRDDRLAIIERSSVSGRLQVTDTSRHGHIFSFYPLNGRFAFSRTSFLGMKSRGNDYLVHILILDNSVFNSLRGDIFLLKDFFSGIKPHSRHEPPRISLPAQKAREFAARPHLSGAQASFSADSLKEILSGMALFPEKTIIKEAPDPDFGAALCETLFSALPPDDRRNASFCSWCHFQGYHPVRLLITNREDIQPVAERYGSRGRLSESPDIKNPATGRALGWLLLCEGSKIQPLFGHSVFSGEAFSDDLRLIEAATEPVGLTEIALASRLAQVASHPLNRDTAWIARYGLPVMAGWFSNEVRRYLNGEAEPAEFGLSCEKMAGFCEKPDWREKAVNLLREDFEKKPSPGGLTAGAVFSLFCAGENGFRLVYGNDSSLFRTDHDVLGWINELAGFRQNQAAFIIMHAFIAGLLKNSGGNRPFFDSLSRLLDLEAPRSQGRNSGAAAMVFASLWRLAGGLEQESARAFFMDWLLAGIDDERLAMTLSQAAAQCAKYDLLPVFPPKAGELMDALAPELATGQPGYLAEAVQRGLDATILERLAAACTKGLSENWDAAADRQVFLACARVAEAMQKASYDGHDAGDATVFLVYNAIMIMAAQEKGVFEDVISIFLSVLEKLAAAPPEGLADICAKAVSKAVTCLSWRPSGLSGPKWASFVQTAQNDADRASIGHKGLFSPQLASFLDIFGAERAFFKTGTGK